jgi:hypothetical protein
MNPYMTVSSNPYMAIYPPSYPSGNNAAANNAAAQQASYAAAAAAPDAAGAMRAGQQAALESYGIPYENGHIKWPLAFRLLPPDKKEKVADRLEGQLVAITQGSGGMVDPTLISGAKRNLTRLSSWLADHQTDMAEATYHDGLAFLHTLDEALTKY